MAPFLVPPQILIKIREAHGVNEEEAKEAFFNREYGMYPEERDKHERGYQKFWFISETDSGRILKVVLAEIESSDELVLMSAYDPSQEDIDYYENKIKNDAANCKR